MPTYDASWIDAVKAENVRLASQAAARAPRPVDPADHPIFNPRVDPEVLRASAAGSVQLTPREQADRLLATLLPGSGPVVLGVAGTIGTAWEHAILTTARSIMRQYHGAISFASIPYPNGIFDNVTRFFGAGRSPDENVLAMVIQGLHDHAPTRPILIVSESQGSWMVAATLEDPKLASDVTRAVLFSTPGFQKPPTGVGQANEGVAQLPGPVGLLQVEHDDDVVPHLFGRLTPGIVGKFLWPILRGRLGGSSAYAPHHYEAHGDDAAAFLLRGERPAHPTHPSSDDPLPPPRTTEHPELGA